MNQILHIFKKDFRSRWPEILISLALLALYTRGELHPWRELTRPDMVSVFLDALWEQFASPILVIFWSFMIVRVVQSESLVGDRQWWTTKPYIWWQLLLAKLLFIFIFICVPLFHAQVFLLNHFRFPVLAKLPALTLRQLSLFVLLIVTVVVLACLTRSLSQFFLTVGAIILVAITASAWANRGTSLSQWKETPAFVDNLSQFLALASAGAVVVWQFARRKRWISVAALLVLLPCAASIGAIFTPVNSVDRSYALLDASSAPIRPSIPPLQVLPESQEPAAARSQYVQLAIPVTLSGPPSGTEVNLDGLKVSATSAQNSQWSVGWQRSGEAFWPEDQKKTLSYDVERKNYEKVRDQLLDLRVELALSEYRLTASRAFRVSSLNFSDLALGDCRVFSFGPPQDMTLTRCLYPLDSPSFVARFDPENSSCTQDEDERFAQMDQVAYAEQAGSEVHFPDPGLSPISDYTLSFRQVAPASSSREKRQKVREVRLCPGTELLLFRPVLMRKFRIQLDLPHSRLQDLAARTRLEIRLRSLPAEN
jgi:hypothetical protein